MGKLDKIKVMLQNILISFNQVSTDKGILVWDGGESLPEVKDNVWVLDVEGNRIPTEDGDYVLEDGTTIQVQNGVVVAISLPSAEPEEPVEAPVEEVPVEEPEESPKGEEPEEQPQEEEPTEEVPEPEQESPSEESPESNDEPEETEPERNLEEEVARLERENGELRERIAELENRIKELESEPAAMSAQEEFKEVTKITKTGNRQLDNLARIINAK